MTILAVKHHIKRTSPKGEPFLGTCILCGQTNLKSQDALKDCPNTRDLTAEQAMVEVISGPKDE